MSDPFIGEIKLFAGNFAPRGWALCDGQLLAISQNDALFSLVGTIYGGDGRTTFGLPDMRGRLPIHKGWGPGLTNRQMGERSGSESVTLIPSELPSHSHAFYADGSAAGSTNPVGNLTAASTSSSIYGAAPPAVAMRGDVLTNAGGSQSHENLMPFLCINFIIALFGIYPSRS